MPCNSDYMEQNGLEKHIQETAQLLLYVKKKMGLKPTKEEKDLDTEYPDTNRGNKVTATLCSLLTDLNGKQRDEIIYNAKDKMSRRLADWWETHQEADRKRMQEELDRIKHEELKKKALNKLTPAEQRLLGL